MPSTASADKHTSERLTTEDEREEARRAHAPRCASSAQSAHADARGEGVKQSVKSVNCGAHGVNTREPHVPDDRTGCSWATRC